MAAADEEQVEDPSVMDIYDVSVTPRARICFMIETDLLMPSITVPTRKEIQIMLTQEELNQGSDTKLLGSAEWIATGLHIEVTKCVRVHVIQ